MRKGLPQRFFAFSVVNVKNRREKAFAQMYKSLLLLWAMIPVSHRGNSRCSKPTELIAIMFCYYFF
jgi:hypothetical protein